MAEETKAPAPTLSGRRGRPAMDRGPEEIVRDSAAGRWTLGPVVLRAKAGRKFFRRKKVCKFCTEKIADINYKDYRLLGQFVAESGKIVPRRLDRRMFAAPAPAGRRPSSRPATSPCCRLPDGHRKRKHAFNVLERLAL